MRRRWLPATCHKRRRVRGRGLARRRASCHAPDVAEITLLMTGGPSGWLPLVFATLGAGAAGSLIATYGSQAVERRKARSEVIASLQKLEDARRREHTMSERFNFSEEDLAELETRCVLARLPRYLVVTYRLANETARSAFGRNDLDLESLRSSSRRLHRHTRLLCDALVERSAELLAINVWHPWLTALYVGRANRILLAALHEMFSMSSRSSGNFKYRLESWRRDRAKVIQQNDRTRRPWRESGRKNADGPPPRDA